MVIEYKSKEGLAALFPNETDLGETFPPINKLFREEIFMRFCQKLRNPELIKSKKINVQFLK